MSVIFRDIMPAVLAALTADTGGLVPMVRGGDIVDTSRATEIRIYGERLPPKPLVSGTIPLLLAPTVVIAGAGGSGLADLPIEAHPRIEVRAYNTDGPKARALWYVVANRLAVQPWFNDPLGVWFEVIDANIPQVDTELGSDFLLARGMIALHALYH